MSSAGELLRAERLRKKWSVEQVTRETKIASRLLDAIEKDQFDQLPHGVSKSFVRQYARFLGLDEEEITAEMQRAMDPAADLPSFAAAPPQTTYKVPKVKEWEGSGSRQSSSFLSSLGMLLVVIAVCSGIYMWWQRSRNPASAPIVRSAAKTARPAAKLKPAAPPPAPPTEAQADAARSNLHASLTADEPTWVRAWADGKEVMTATLEPNLVKTVDAVGEIRLRTGNAGALQITLNGKPVGTPGPKGQIRIVTLTPQGVQILVPPKPAPEPAAPL
jgi:cytoskeleton protein RodZ